MSRESAENSASVEAMEEAKLRVLRAASGFLLVAPAVNLALLFSAFPEHARRGIGPALIMALAIATLLLLRGGHARAAARLFVYGGWAGLAVAILLGGGIYAPQVVAFPLVVMLAGWLLGSRHAVAITLLSVLFGLALAAATHLAMLPPVTPAPAVLAWLSIALISSLVCLLIAYIVSTHESQLEEVRRLGAELAGRVDDLAAERNQLYLLAETMPAMIFHGDRDLLCRYANRRFADFFHGGGVPLEGMHLREILGEAVFEAALPNIRRVLSGEQVLLEGERKSAGGEERVLEISLVPERDGAGTVAGFYALKRDVTDRQAAERALSESEAQLRLVAESVPAMIAYYDRGFTLRYANRNYLAFFGLDGGAIGRPVRDILGEEAFGNVRALLQQALDGEAVRYRTARRSAADEDRMFEVDVVPDRGADGIVRGAYALMRDITEQQRAEEEIRRLNAGLEQRVQERTAELQTANKELESFAYSISHDLRAPLRGIDGFSHLLAEDYAERLDDTGRGYLDRVRRAAQRMGELIDDILELSRVTRLDMRRERVDLSLIAGAVVEERLRIEPGRRVEVALAPDCMAYGDPQLLRVLLQNLLENAWKYTGRKDEACIEFGCESADGEQVFFVRDNGVGFDMKYAERLFSPFQRLHSPEEFEGTGIGLATVARVAHRHGGRVWAESVQGRGATFRFSLPAAGHER